MNIYEKLSNARDEFHKLELKKSGHNKFANYYYFELADFLIPALSIIKACGLVTFISFGKEIALLKLVDMENPDQIIEIQTPMSTAALKGCHEVQNLGAVQTYLRRYLWVALLEIVEHDALDSSPKLAEKGDIRGTAKVMGASQGIGDDIPEDWKTYLQDTAKIVVALIEKGEFEQAEIEMFKEQLPDVDYQVYLENQMGSKARNALRKFKETKGK